jgi:hypothetical protein
MFILFILYTFMISFKGSVHMYIHIDNVGIQCMGD